MDERSEISARFLARLWAAQAAAGLTDVELSRELGRADNYVGRLKRRPKGALVSLELAVAASLRFPEVGRFLASEIRVGIDSFPSEEGAR